MKLTKNREIFEKSIISRRETRKNPFLVPRFSAEKFATLTVVHNFAICVFIEVCFLLLLRYQHEICRSFAINHQEMYTLCFSSKYSFHLIQKQNKGTWQRNVPNSNSGIYSSNWYSIHSKIILIGTVPKI